MKDNEKFIYRKCKLKLVKEKTVKYSPTFSVEIKNPEALNTILKELKMDQEPEEILVVIGMDAAHRAVCVFEVARGTIDCCQFSARDVFKRLLVCNSTSFVIAHNHPSGTCTPSDSDVKCAKELKKSGEMIGIELIDSLIVADGLFTSLKEKELF